MGKPWADWEVEILRRDYRSSRDACQRLADRLGRSFTSVKGKAALLGVTKHRGYYWTEKEVETLCELVPRYSLRTVAKRMKRTLASVSLKARRIHLSRRHRDGWYIQNEVIDILGVDHHKIDAWVKAGFLIRKPHSEVVPSQKGAATWEITEEDLKDFITKHANLLHGQNVDIEQVVTILTGGERDNVKVSKRLPGRSRAHGDAVVREPARRGRPKVERPGGEETAERGLGGRVQEAGLRRPGKRVLVLATR